MRKKWSDLCYYLHVTETELDVEARQCIDEGKDISSLKEEFDELKRLNLSEEANMVRAEALLDTTMALPVSDSHPYREPSDLQGICAERPVPVSLPEYSLSDEALFDKVYGAWLGRCSGCMLGKPVEGRSRAKIRKYLEAQGRWPLDYYFSLDADPELKKECDMAGDWKHASAEHIDRSTEDDDTNYTVTGLAILKKHGATFTPEDVAGFWLCNIPVFHMCTAERIAYRNLLQLVPPPASAEYRNVYREWIGAQIRGDFFGYVSPAKLEQAADYAWRDACISHVKNGIYGEMWVAAMLAAAYVTDDIETIIRAGLSQIPDNSRLTERIEGIIHLYHIGASYDEVIEGLHTKWNESSVHDWCHTISNAVIVAIALLWGEKDFTRTLGYSVMPGFDTDCNGATVGSILGLVLGAKALPEKWVKPLNDTLETGIAGWHSVKISDLARETIELMA